MHRLLNFWFFLTVCAPCLLMAQLDSAPLVEGVGVEEHLDQFVDSDLELVNAAGAKVKMGDYLDQGLPIVIAPVYYNCPNLCTLVLNGVRDLIDELDLELGRDYRVLNVSFDPENTPELARAKAESYYASLSGPEKDPRYWNFLTGDRASVARLMDQIGFRYKKVEEQFSHASVLVLLSPRGRITRYVYGVTYPPRQVRLALVEAADGKVGSTIDKLLIYCFKYDALAGKYVPYAWGIMRIGGMLTLLVMAMTLLFLWKRERSNKRRLGQNV